MTKGLAVEKHEGEQLPAHGGGGDVGDVSGLVRLALERGVDVDVIERLVGLQERVTERNARAAFIAALAAFQEECPEIPKTATVDYVNRDGGRVHYKFAPLEEITRTIRPYLTKHGLSYSWDSALAPNNALEIVFTLRHIEGHSEQSRFTCPVDTAAKMSGPQKVGAASTYGRRQSLIQGLGLTTADQDNDGDDGSGSGTGEVITDGQLADLEALMKEVGQDRARFLKWAQVDSLGKLPAAKYDEAIAVLEQKRKQPT